MLSPARGWGARRRFRRRRTVRPRDLGGLHSSHRSGWRSTLDTVGEALDPRARRSPEPARRSGGGVETGPVSEEFAALAGEERRRTGWSWPLALALLVSVLVTAWVWRDLADGLRPGGVGRVGVVGPELGPATTDAAGLWASSVDAWRGGGLGHDRAAESWLVPGAALSALAGLLPGAGPTAAATALAWVLALAAPLSVLTAYVALRRATRRRWPRALLALAWAGLAPLTAAVSDGRVGPVVVHLLAPLLVAGYAVAASRTGGPRRTASVFATVLGVVVAAQWVPPLLVLATLGGLALVLLGRGSARWRGAVLALLPWALMAPALPALWADPVRLAGGAGATVAAPGLPSAAPAWQLALLDPTGVQAAASPAAVPLWLVLPLWLGALAALLLPRRRGRRAAVWVAVALTCLGATLLVVRSGLGVLPSGHAEAGLVVTAWPGTLLSLVGAALLLAVGLLADALLAGAERPSPRGRREGPRGREGSGRPVVRGPEGAEDPEAPERPAGSSGARARWATLAAGLVLVPPSALALWPVTPWAAEIELRSGTDPLPAVAAEQARGPAALRTLVLEPVGPGPAEGLRVDLLGAEPEPAWILRDRTADLSAAPSDEGPADGPLEPAVDAVRALVDGADAEEVGRSLVDLGVGYVLLRGADADPPEAADAGARETADADVPETAAALVARVDRVAGLTRVSSPPDQVLWRMAQGEPARVRLVGPDGAVLDRVPVSGPHARVDARLVEVPEGAVLQVAEGAGWAEAVTVLVDDEPVTLRAGAPLTATGATGVTGATGEGPDAAPGAGLTAPVPAGDHQVRADVRAAGLPWHLVSLALGLVTAFLALPFGRTEQDLQEDA